MAEREQGDFELVLGNKQLFSVLLLVIVLLGIFFAMGYLAGKSGPVVAPKETAIKIPTPPQRSEPAVVPETKTEPPSPAPRMEKTPEPVPKEPPKPPARSAPPAEVEGTAGPPDGKYLQAAALPKANAEAMAKLFARDGQSAHLAEAPGKNKSDEPIYRVLVGPFADNAEIAKARTYLKEKGIDKPIPRTYPDARSN